MKKFIILLSVLAGMTACNQAKDDGGEGERIKALGQYKGAWASSYLDFTTDQCAFSFVSESTDKTFTLSNLNVDCRKMGLMGLFAPMTFQLTEKSKARVDSVANSAPDGAMIASRSSAYSNSGWVDLKSGMVYFDLTTDKTLAANKISFKGKVLANGDLELQELRISNKVSFDRVTMMSKLTDAGVQLIQRDLMSSLAVPAAAMLSTSGANRHYLYCADQGSNPTTGLIHMSGKKYPLSGGTSIGEMGFLGYGSSTVNMIGTNSGSYQVLEGHPTYSLSLLMTGGRTTYADIQVIGNSALVSFRGAVPMICKFIQNDILRGYSGWNP